MASDQELIDRCLAGDRSAFDGIVHRYQDGLFRHLLRLAGNPEQAEDLCQEAFVKFYQALPRFNCGRAVAPLLFTIATNLWRDGRHRAAARLAPVECNPGEVRVAEEAIRRVERDLIARAIGGLRSEYREVLSLRFDRGLSYREIAEVTGASEGTVGTWLRRALEALRGVLADWDGGEQGEVWQ